MARTTPRARISRLRLTLIGLAVSGLGASVVPAGAGPVGTLGTESGADDVRYGRDVRPILSDRCFQCHGGDAGTREAGLRLDERAIATALREGHAVIVPGDPEASELWQRITSSDPDEVMPPVRAKKRPLTAADLDVLERWITAGAAYEEHWSFVAPVRPEPPVSPESRAPEAAWGHNPIDAFVLAELERHGVGPSEAADPATLLRRVFLDLTGLPPTVAELDAFLADDQPGAYERQVERLLTEEPYRTRLGEHLATYWLDAARYADTNGIHMDAGRQMWAWRDWVMRALRDGMPFDRFVIEQLAGDLLPDATTDQKIASGFNRNHVITDEGGAISDEYLVEYAVDRVTTTSSVFLGLTMGCARCHDHKFDPITQEDFYGLMSFFNSVEEPGLYSQESDPNRAFEPFLELPSAEQQAELVAIEARLEDLTRRLEEPLPGEDERRAAFLGELASRSGVDWSIPDVVSAISSEPGTTLELQDDGALLARGPHPTSEDYIVQLQSDADDLRLLLLECLSEEESGPGAGRASHGNAVLTRVTLEARPAGQSVDWIPVPLHWAWADHSQQDRDFDADNVLSDGNLGWALDGNEAAGARDLLLLTEEAFGHPDGTELRVKVSFRSPYGQHSLERIRFRVSPLADTTLLPVSAGRWHAAGPFRPVPATDTRAAYDTAFGPESVELIDTEARFSPDGEEELAWTFEERFVDEEVVLLSDGIGAHYIAREIWSPDARELDLSLGSDDGILIFLNGELAFENRVDRGTAPDQDQTRLSLQAGRNMLVYKIVNTGGPSGYYYRALPPEHVLTGELPSALLPEDAIPLEQRGDLQEAWRRRFFESYRQLDDERVATEEERGITEASIPRTMVMREMEEPRPTYVLTRGQYDHPDEERSVGRVAPAFLPELPADAPRDRLGLAQWLVAAENPLFARVTVNRFWENLFGAGLVRTSQDFGFQGEWPTHPELLDWLAVQFRESGWDVHGLLRQMVLSSTYRQGSNPRPELAERDPDNRWLAFYPRRRLLAEQIRDHALYTSGLLVETFGGPSVKPYQPEGLWREVAMLQSNTREFTRDDGDALWRRSVYTYWKRANPPPSLQTFDAPTRESCIIRRQRTNTPLQALVLWNDVQFVEAARALAARVLAVAEEDSERVTWLVRTCTGRAPLVEERDLILAATAEYRERFAAVPEDADALLTVGEAPLPMETDAVELATWTLIANAVLNLHETLTQD